MILILLSAAFVGFIHSLAPGHWLPVVLVVKTQRWNSAQAAFGAFVAALGHLLISTVLGFIAIAIGVSIFSQHAAEFERYSGAALILFGLTYAAVTYFRHSSCHGHTHHGDEPGASIAKTPLFFLFTLGFSPCIAVLPLFLTASAHGYFAAGITMIAFCVGVVIALVSATVLTTRGLLKLDHPILEHYGDVIAGMGISAMGILLCIFPQIG